MRGFLEVSLLRGSEDSSLPSGPPRLRAPRTLTRQYTRGRRPSCPSPRTPRENCAYVPARTQTRAAPFQSCAMCVCPVLAPHGRPAPPAPATRPSHHQSKPHIHSRRDARAAAHLTSTTSPFCALCRLCTLLLASHKRLYQDAPRVRRRFCTTQGAHARTHPHARSSAQSYAQPVSLPAHTAYSTISPRAPHCAPAASRLSALHEARAWHAARTHARTSARARSTALCCTDRQPACTHSIQHHGHAYA